MNRLSYVSIYLAILIALLSARPWFSWGQSFVIIVALFFFIITRLLVMKNKIRKINIVPTLSYIILSVYIYIINAPDLGTAFTQTCTKIIPLCLFIQLSNEERKKFIDYFTSIFSGILLLSLLFFILFKLGVPLPYSKISHIDAHYSEFYNYYAFIIDGDLGIFTRFRSVFTEPGHVGMFAAILLYVNNFKISNWKLITLLVSIIWSFSLAAYILLVLGGLIYMVSNIKKKAYVLLIPLLVLIFYGSINLYFKSNKDSLISELIISRLQITEDGNLAGNNRHTETFLSYYDKFKETPQYITGLGSAKFSNLSFLSGNASFKNYILEHGIIGILLLMNFGLSCLYSYRSRSYVGLFILYFAAFLQRPYALWEVESFLYIAYSCNVIYKKDSSNSALI